MGQIELLPLGGEWKCSVPLPPSANNLYPTGRGGLRTRSEEYNLWARLAWLAMDRDGFPQIEPAKWKKGKTGAPLPVRDTRRWRVRFVAYCKEWRRDLDNMHKAPIDLLSDRLNLNDVYNVEVHSDKIVDKQEEERLEITFSFVE